MRRSWGRGAGGGLVALNGVLLAMLAFLLVRSPAGAQNEPPRARGEYTMVAGKLNAGGPPGVYIVDSNNQELVVLRWDQTKQTMLALAYRNIGTDSKAVPGR